MKPESMIPLFDEYLHKQGETFATIVVGGAALAIMDIIQRETQDCDILDPMIPDRIEAIAKKFAKKFTTEGNRQGGFAESQDFFILRPRAGSGRLYQAQSFEKGVIGIERVAFRQRRESWLGGPCRSVASITREGFGL